MAESRYNTPTRDAVWAGLGDAANSLVHKAALQVSSTAGYLEDPGDVVTRYLLRTMVSCPPEQFAIAQLAVLDACHDDAGALGESGDSLQLRLQMVIAQREQFVESLPNLAEKVTQTNDAIIANLHD